MGTRHLLREWASKRSFSITVNVVKNVFEKSY